MLLKALYTTKAIVKASSQPFYLLSAANVKKRWRATIPLTKKMYQMIILLSLIASLHMIVVYKINLSHRFFFIRNLTLGSP